MSVDQQFSNLAETAQLVVEEFDCALRVTNAGKLDEQREMMVASSFAAGVSQLGMLVRPMLVAALDLEMAAAVHH